MTHIAPEPPSPVYRGLDRCDVASCGAHLAPRERLAGLCAGCKAAPPSQVPHAPFSP
jgi:hypothetical protein